MTKKIFPFMLIALLTLASCHKKGDLLNDQRIFAGNNWQRFDTQTFEIKVPTNDECYNLYTIVEIDTAKVKDDALPLNINLYSPNGEHRMFRTLVNLRNRNGLWLGEMKDGYMVYAHKARANFFFNVDGTHKMEISQGTSHYDLPCVHSLTLKVEQAIIEYPE